MTSTAKAPLVMRSWHGLVGLTDPGRPVSRALFVGLAGAVFLVDQFTKLAAVEWLMGRPGIIVIPGLFNLQYATNTGAAFSIASDHTGLLTIFSLVVTIVLAVWGWRLRREEHGMRLGLGLIVGGAAGNVIDRARLGYVIDFLDVHWFNRAHWPTFNVADSAICVGIVLWLLATWRLSRLEKQQAAAATEPAPRHRPGRTR